MTYTVAPDTTSDAEAQSTQRESGMHRGNHLPSFFADVFFV